MDIKDPYDGIEFELKKVQIKDKDNNIIFEAEIEFPKDFDDNAAAIVASRYLCNDAKHKETSIKQMFDRVSNTISNWGKEQGYFVSQTDMSGDSILKTTEFNYKLKYYQIHKYFAFNSPVYFNIGLQENPQSSACFILSVDDNMDSITELGKIEAQIFKKGSGAGSNLSTLRSSKEPVKGGGCASGPVSFLKAHDVLAGVVKSGGTLRRSAKLACLDISHPDIEDFIDCKIFEEEKLAALRKIGIKNRPGYDLNDEVYFQNTNLTVRVTDKFMQAVIDDRFWSTKYVKNKEIYKTYKAKELLMKIAEVSHKIADPGLQFHDNINRWNSLANDGEIVASNPCGEYVSLNNTSCNLASINLMKFFLKDKNNNFKFDYETFEDVIKTVITAQDILIDNSSYPNENITNNTRKYRNLGLGYTNLGGLLMWLGIPYDSNLGRFVAAGLTALMTGIAFKTSAELAEKVGEFEAFERNKEHIFKIINQHFKLMNGMFENASSDNYLSEIIKQNYSTWNEVLTKKVFRNAQVSLLAPTGTTSFIMNSITTGIEPEYSLIRYKRLAGSDGATLKVINPIVEESLKNLGYSKTEIPKLIKELIEPDLEKPSGFKDWKFGDVKHRDVFLTAAPTPGTDLYIDYMGHVKMCAAVQPFLSGAISKTINLPKKCSINEIYNLYIEAWKMGLKGITIYRDGSKNFQPLSTEKEKKQEIIIDKSKKIKKRLPNERPAITHKFKIAGTEGYITCGMYSEDNSLGEIFVNISKEGSTISGFADAIATVTSIALQYGVPLKDFVSKLSYLKFEPHGFSSNPDIRIAHSIIDYIFRYIGLKFLSYEDRKDLGLLSTTEIDLSKQEIQSQSIHLVTQDDTSPSCPNCHTQMRRLGSCYFCTNCAYNQGSCG